MGVMRRVRPSRMGGLAAIAVATFLVAAGNLSGGPAIGQTVGSDPYIFVPAESGVAWWARASVIRPTGSSVTGISIDAFNRALNDPENEWCFANATNARSFVSEDRGTQTAIDQRLAASSPPLFRTSGSFTGNEPLDAVVGHYAGCDGQVGAFIVITARSISEPRIIFVDAFEDWGPLIYMEPVPDGVAVSSCFECGHLEGLFYDPARRRFYWESLGD